MQSLLELCSIASSEKCKLRLEYSPNKLRTLAVMPELLGDMLASRSGPRKSKLMQVQRQMRQDQPAWISYTVETVGPSGVPAVGHPFLIRITVKNIGKSAAIKLMTCTAADFLPKEKLPTFECPGPGKHYVSGGTIFPGSWNFTDLVLTQNYFANRQRQNHVQQLECMGIWAYSIPRCIRCRAQV